MALLKNLRHERFAQELAAGKGVSEAFETAGFEPNRGNASRLKADENIQARVQEILESAALRVEITQARVLQELGKIGFADIRRAVQWYSQANVAQVDDDADTEALIEEGEIRFAVANQVELVSSDKIDDDTAAAIAEVKMTDKGGLSIKLHDKRAALVDIGRHLGMFKDRVEIDGKHSHTHDAASLSEVFGWLEEASRASRETTH